MLTLEFRSWGKTREAKHRSRSHLLTAKPSRFSPHPRWPQEQSQLMNQKKAGYQMSWLINTHIAFCKGIRRASCVEPEMAEGDFSSPISFRTWVCFAAFREWLLPRVSLWQAYSLAGAGLGSKEPLLQGHRTPLLSQPFLLPLICAELLTWPLIRGKKDNGNTVRSWCEGKSQLGLIGFHHSSF